MQIRQLIFACVPAPSRILCASALRKCTSRQCACYCLQRLQVLKYLRLKFPFSLIRNIPEEMLMLLARAVAHRGLHGAGVAQNSVESFKAAWAAGARQIETDFFMLESGRILCVHDKTELKKVACEDFLRDIPKLTDSEIAAIDIGKFARTEKPVRMPYLEEVLATVPRTGVAQCEIKVYGDSFADLFDCSVKEAGLTEANILVTSFSDTAIADFKQKYPLYDTLWLGAWLENVKDEADIEKALTRAKEIGVRYVCPWAGSSVSGFTREVADKIRAAGLEVRLYGVNSPEQLRFAAEIGATGFTTDHWKESFGWADSIGGLKLE